MKYIEKLFTIIGWFCVGLAILLSFTLIIILISIGLDIITK